MSIPSKIAFSLLLLASLAPMMSSFTTVNAQMTTVTNFMTTSTTYVSTSVSYWIMTDSTEYHLYTGSFSVPAAQSDVSGNQLCSVQSIGPFPASAGDVVFAVGTTDSPILVGPVVKSDVDALTSLPSNTANPQYGCARFMFLMGNMFGGIQTQTGRFSLNWTLPAWTGTDNWYLVFFNDSPSTVNVSVSFYLAIFTLFTNTVFQTPTVTMTTTSTQVNVAPTLVYLIEDNFLVIVAVVLLCLVIVALRRGWHQKETKQAPTLSQSVKSRQCVKCGAELPPASDFCNKCGTKQQ